MFDWSLQQETTVFVVDESQLESTELNELSKVLCDSRSVYLTNGKRVNYWIPKDKVIKVIDSEDFGGNTRFLEQAWLLTENASKIKEIRAEFDGNAIHLLIMGLQQALFIEPTGETSINDLIFPVAIDFIEKISNEDKNLKEAYIVGFSCEYISQARKLLFP